MILGEFTDVSVNATARYAERFSIKRYPSNITIRDLSNRARYGRLFREGPLYECKKNGVGTLTILEMIHTFALAKLRRNQEYLSPRFTAL